VVLRVQVTQPVSNPSPGFRKTAPECDCTDLTVQPHWPYGVKSIRACTETQYPAPPARPQTGLTVIVKSLPPVYDCLSRSQTSVSGSLSVEFV
jgi:hypothetical protein